MEEGEEEIHGLEVEENQQEGEEVRAVEVTLRSLVAQNLVAVAEPGTLLVMEAGPKMVASSLEGKEMEALLEGKVEEKGVLAAMTGRVVEETVVEGNARAVVEQLNQHNEYCQSIQTNIVRWTYDHQVSAEVALLASECRRHYLLLLLA